MKKQIVIGSRGSRLALAQTAQVASYIEAADPEIIVEIKKIETTGDKRLDVTLDKIGGKGLFVKELDKALMEGEIHLAVHSLKDMPMEESDEIPVVAYSKREDPRDVLVLPRGKQEGKYGGRIGCSSFRRRLQAERLFPGADFVPVRGNILTRLEKLDRGEFDALILAAAGLKRAGLSHRISRYFSVEEILPAAGQGILAVQGRKGQDVSFLAGYGQPASEAAALAERAFVRRLDGGCTSPVAAYAETVEGRLHLKGLFYNGTGSYFIGEKTGRMEQAEELGILLAEEMERKYTR